MKGNHVIQTFKSRIFITDSTMDGKKNGGVVVLKSYHGIYTKLNDGTKE